jgi:hypothetical protein
VDPGFVPCFLPVHVSDLTSILLSIPGSHTPGSAPDPKLRARPIEIIHGSTKVYKGAASNWP